MALDCIGYIPAPREGHAAAIVDDVMYIFGGRTEEGADLGDLAAFRISSRRWYTFQNMGPSPSPRSGHSMTAYNKQVVVLAGEPSTATREAGDLGIVYLLDTSKIRYPNDQAVQPAPAASLSLFLYRYLFVWSSAVCCCFIIAFSFLPVRQTIQQLRPPCINRGSSSKFPSPTQPFISNTTSTQLAHDPHPIILWPGTNILCCLTTPTGDVAASESIPSSP